jgi:hypothetical protein
MHFIFQILAKRQLLNWKNMLRLADLHTALNVSLKKMSLLVEEVFNEEPYTKLQVSSEFSLLHP